MCDSEHASWRRDFELAFCALPFIHSDNHGYSFLCGRIDGFDEEESTLIVSHFDTTGLAILVEVERHHVVRGVNSHPIILIKRGHEVHDLLGVVATTVFTIFNLLVHRCNKLIGYTRA